MWPTILCQPFVNMFNLLFEALVKVHTQEKSHCNEFEAASYKLVEVNLCLLCLYVTYTMSECTMCPCQVHIG